MSHSIKREIYVFYFTDGCLKRQLGICYKTGYIGFVLHCQTQSKVEDITYYCGEPAAVPMVPLTCWNVDAK